MKSLSDTKQQEVDELIDKAYEFYESGEKQRSFELLQKAYNLYPEPTEFPEAYNTAKYNFNDYMKEGDYTNAKIWLNKMIDNNNNLHHSDNDCSFSVAKFHFKSNNFDEALKLFKEVVSDAGMRYFGDEPSEYKDFYLHPEKYMK